MFRLNNPYFLLSLILLLSGIARAIALFTPETWIDEGTVGLMGLHAMQGEFPIFFYGQKFMGAIEAYLYGSFFLFVGPSPLTLELLPTLLSILFILLTYLLAKRIFDFKVALCSTLLLALPPTFLMFWTHEARLHYSLILIFGNLIFLLTHKILYERSPAPQRLTSVCILLGILIGISWWTNYLVIVYLLPAVGLIVYRDRGIIFRKEFYLAFFFCFLGSLPLWAFNFRHDLPILGVWESTKFSLTGLSFKLKALFANALPIILGFLPPLSKDKFELIGYLILGSILLAALLFYIFRNKVGGISGSSKTKGGELLILLLLSTTLIDLFAGYGSWLNEPCQRYLLPLYSAVPILVGFLLLGIWFKSKPLAVFMTSLILFFNLAGNLKHTTHPFRWKDTYTIYNGWIIFDSVALGKYRDNEKKEAGLIHFLKTNGYSYIYAGEELRKKLTFKSRESIIFSDPYQEIYLKYADLVDGALNPAYLFEKEKPLFEDNLKAIGAQYRKINLGNGFILYGDFAPSFAGERMLPGGLWKGFSNSRSSPVHYAFDRDVGTAWKTEGPQDPGTYYSLDLGKIETINKISYIPDSYRDVPVGYQVAVSRDGNNWRLVSQVSQYWGPFFWSGTHPMVKIRRGRLESVFEPIPARFIKLLLTGKDKNRPWSINEMVVFSPDKERTFSYPDRKDIQALLSFLEAQRLNFVYADHWLSAVIRIKSNWKIKTIASNHYLGNNGERFPLPDLFPATRTDSKTGFVLENDYQEYFEETLRKLQVSYQTKEFGPVRLFYGLSGTEKASEILARYYWSGTMLLKRPAGK